MKEKVFKTKELDLIAYLRFKRFEPKGLPIKDERGTKWVSFIETEDLKKAVNSFVSWNPERELLYELRKARSFLLDSQQGYLTV